MHKYMTKKCVMYDRLNLGIWYYNCNVVVERTNLNTYLFRNTWFKESSNMKIEKPLRVTINSCKR